jgi:hypothetical protein
MRVQGAPLQHNSLSQLEQPIAFADAVRTTIGHLQIPALERRRQRYTGICHSSRAAVDQRPQLIGSMAV